MKVKHQLVPHLIITAAFWGIFASSFYLTGVDNGMIVFLLLSIILTAFCAWYLIILRRESRG